MGLRALKSTEVFFLHVVEMRGMRVQKFSLLIEISLNVTSVLDDIFFQSWCLPVFDSLPPAVGEHNLQKYIDRGVF